jgi:hypothetical protein
MVQVARLLEQRCNLQAKPDAQWALFVMKSRVLRGWADSFPVARRKLKVKLSTAIRGVAGSKVFHLCATSAGPDIRRTLDGIWKNGKAA